MKAELAEKESEYEGRISRLTSKHSSELTDIKYQLQDSEQKKSEQAKELSKLQSKLTEHLQLQEHITTLRSQNEVLEHKIKTLIDDKERLQEETLSVSNLMVKEKERYCGIMLLYRR